MGEETMKPATQIAHWPGKDVPVCEDHARQLTGVASAMGFQVTLTPCEETTCTNCEGPARRAEGKQ